MMSSNVDTTISKETLKWHLKDFPEISDQDIDDIVYEMDWYLNICYE